MTDTVNVPVDEVLDAVADYLVEQYGKSFGLNHHLDRARIKSSLRAQPEAQKGEQEPVAYVSRKGFTPSALNPLSSDGGFFVRVTENSACVKSTLCATTDQRRRAIKH